jgi:hypothetical protein
VLAVPSAEQEPRSPHDDGVDPPDESPDVPSVESPDDLSDESPDDPSVEQEPRSPHDDVDPPDESPDVPSVESPDDPSVEQEPRSPHDDDVDPPDRLSASDPSGVTQARAVPAGTRTRADAAKGSSRRRVHQRCHPPPETVRAPSSPDTGMC